MSEKPEQVENIQDTPQTQEQDLGTDRESILAGMAELQNAPLEPGDVDLTQTSDPDEAAKSEQEAEPEEVEAEEAEEAEETEEVSADSAIDSDLEKIQQAEKRSKERLSEHIAAERSELARERAEFDALLSEAKEIKADHEASKRRTFDAKGKSHAELMAEARRLHALAIASDPEADPAQKATAQRTVREAQMEERLAAAEKRAEEADKRWQAREQETANKAQAEKILAGSIEAVTAETPLTKMALSGSGSKEAGERLLNITAALYQQTGEMPDPVDVHKYFEEAERKFYTDRGLDPDLVVKTSRKTTTTKNKPPVAGEKTSAPTLGNDLTTSTQPRTTPMTEQEEREDIIKGMSQL